MPAYDCDAVNQRLVQEEGRLSGQIYDQTFVMSPWTALVESDWFPDNMGYSVSDIQIGRSRPTHEETAWDAVQASDGTINQCLPTVTKVQVDQKLRSYSVRRKALESDDFCLEDLRYTYNPAAQIDKKVNEFGNYVQQEWVNEYKRDYIEISGYKVVNNAAMDITTASTMPTTLATSQLDMGTLKRLYQKNIREGATATQRSNGAPIYTVIGGAETIDYLILQNADIRQDYRWAEPSELLKALGVERVYGGFYFMIDPFPPRFNYVGGAYVRISAFRDKDLGDGKKEQEINPAYETAEFEVTFIYNKDVFKSLKLKPTSGYNDAKQNGDPVNYTGLFKWKNILDRVCNPDGNIGFWRGILAHAPAPVMPQYGYTIVHRRCDPVRHLTTYCS